MSKSSAVQQPASRPKTDRSSAVLMGVALGVGAVALLTATGPNGPTGMVLVLLPGLGLLAIGCWLAFAIHSLLVRRLPPGLIVAPVIGVLVAGLVYTSAAARLRFGLLDRVAFEGVVAQAPEPIVVLPDRDLTSEESSELEGDFPGPCPAWIGTLRIRTCSTFAAGYLFYDKAGSGFIDDGGIAYMPDGIPRHDVGNGNFESPQFNHLTGPWYAFASSW